MSTYSKTDWVQTHWNWYKSTKIKTLNWHTKVYNCVLDMITWLDRTLPCELSLDGWVCDMVHNDPEQICKPKRWKLFENSHKDSSHYHITCIHQSSNDYLIHFRSAKRKQCHFAITRHECGKSGLKGNSPDTDEKVSRGSMIRMVHTHTWLRHKKKSNLHAAKCTMAPLLSPDFTSQPDWWMKCWSGQ
jgi:hypothetical protein